MNPRLGLGTWSPPELLYLPNLNREKMAWKNLLEFKAPPPFILYGVNKILAN